MDNRIMTKEDMLFAPHEPATTPKMKEKPKKLKKNMYKVWTQYATDKSKAMQCIFDEFVCVDGGFAKNEPIDVVVRPEDIDIVAPENGMLTGVVTAVTFKGVHYEIIVDVQGFKWMIQSTDYCAPDSTIGLYIEPDAIHVMKKSQYSNMFGDYSSFSEEFDELSDADADNEEEGSDQ